MGKTCEKCGTHYEQAAGNFYRSTNARDGFLTRCVACERAYHQAYRATEAYARKREQYNQDRREIIRRLYKDPAYRAEQRAIAKAYRERYSKIHRFANEAIKRALLRRDGKTCTRCRVAYRDVAENFSVVRRKGQRPRYSSHCRKCYVGHADRWRRANMERARALVRRYLARRAGATGDATAEQVAARVAFFGWRCWMCKGPWDSIDHVIPLSRGGSNWPANLRPACRRCNSAKNDRKPGEARRPHRPRRRRAPDAFPLCALGSGDSGSSPDPARLLE